MSATLKAPPRRRPTTTATPPARASLTAPRTRPRPPVRTPAPSTRANPRTTPRTAPRTIPRTAPGTTPRSTPRAAPKTTTRTAPKSSPRKVATRPAGPKPGARRRLGMVVVLGIAVILTIVAFHAVLAQNQVELERTRARIAVAEDRYENARLKNSVLSSPARITQRATDIGMVVPDVAPISVAVPGEVPKRGSETTALADWSEVKGHLVSSP